MGNRLRPCGNRRANAHASARRIVTPTRPLRLLLPVLAILGVASAYAALPTFWQVSTEAEFLSGKVENLSIDSYGRLTLGPTSTPIYESNAPFLWTVISTP